MRPLRSLVRSLRGERAAKAVTLVAVVAGVAGVAVTGLPPRADVAVAPTVSRDLAAWSMPLDGYVRPASALENHAELLVEEPCLRAAGVTWDVPHRDPDALVAEDDRDMTAARGDTAPALATTRPLDPALAATRGYHGPSTAGADDAAWRRWAFDPARNTIDQDVSARCIHDARRTLGVLGASGPESGRQEAASDTARRLTYFAAVEARSDGSVVAAVARWRSCVVAAGVRHVAASPSDMPTSIAEAVFGSTVPGSAVSTAERRTAVADATCQASSGYRRALYDAEWSRLTSVTADDARTLTRGSSDMPAYAAALRSTVLRLQS